MRFKLNHVWRVLSTGLLACGLVMILATAPSHGCPEGFCSQKTCSSGRTCVVQEIWYRVRYANQGVTMFVCANMVYVPILGQPVGVLYVLHLYLAIRRS